MYTTFIYRSSFMNINNIAYHRTVSFSNVTLHKQLIIHCIHTQLSMFQTHSCLFLVVFVKNRMMFTFSSQPPFWAITWLLLRISSSMQNLPRSQCSDDIHCNYVNFKSCHFLVLDRPVCTITIFYLQARLTSYMYIMFIACC